MCHRVVVIDDDPAVRILLGCLLEDQGDEMIPVACPEEALPTICAARPQAIILDLRMQTATDGWRILAQVQADPEIGHTPVIICSADLEQLRRHAAQCTERRCVLLPKPFDVEELLALLHQLTDPAHQR